MMVNWELIVETAVKWFIPTILIAIVSLITVKIINPLKKGIGSNQQETWDQCMRNSKVPEEMCDETYKKLRAESDKKDDEIIAKIDKLTACINEQGENSKKYHVQVDKKIETLQLGVLDSHLQGLVQTCDKYIRRGYITATELQAYQERLNTYHKLGGNGHMDIWDQKIRALPQEPSQKHSGFNSTVNTQPPLTHK